MPLSKRWNVASLSVAEFVKNFGCARFHWKTEILGEIGYEQILFMAEFVLVRGTDQSKHLHLKGRFLQINLAAMKRSSRASSSSRSNGLDT